MVERIRALLALRQLTPTQFADLIQVGRPIISHILSGRNKASLEVVQRIMAALPEVALPWLLSGTGSMLNNSEERFYDDFVSNQGGRDELSRAASLAPTGERSVAAANKPAQSGSSPASIAKAIKVSPVTSGPAAQLLRPIGSSQPRKFRAGTTNPATDSQQTPRSPGKSLTNPSPANFPAEAVSATSPAQEVQAADALVTNMPAEQPAGLVSTPTAPPEGISLPQQPQSIPPLPTPPSRVSVTPAAWPATSRGGADKPIRRIILFYHDGSFADFQPES
ncbi:helix-turn-helix domain-containing protein [uncultured Hymenobacter sp.]|uniref:helix-turn-helix domain-containing protein n=1 Tax=uncultured Hymenobacter sp. TaxID=170016 RepID=UPI0035CC7C11